MKILIEINPLALRDRTGVPYFIYFLCQELLRQRGDDRYILWGPDVESDPYPEIRDKIFRSNYFVSRAAWDTIWQMSNKGAISEEVDIYHVPFAALPAPYNREKTKLVLTVYDLAFAYYPEAVPDKGTFHYLSTAFPTLTEKADKILAISQSTKNDLINILDVDADKIEVTYPGTDLCKPDMQSGRTFPLYEKLQVPEKYILCVGTWEPRKNLSLLFKAFNSLKNKMRQQGIKICVVGDKGWKYHEAERLVEELGLHDDVVPLGYVPREVLPMLFSQALMFVYPSLYEGFGLPVLEALVCGAPVITSNVSSLPEVVGEAGLLIDPHSVDDLAHAMENLLDNGELRDRLITDGYQQAKKFSWAAAAQQTRTAYHSF